MLHEGDEVRKKVEPSCVGTVIDRDTPEYAARNVWIRWHSGRHAGKELHGDPDGYELVVPAVREGDEVRMGSQMGFRATVREVYDVRTAVIVDEHGGEHEVPCSRLVRQEPPAAPEVRLFAARALAAKCAIGRAEARLEALVEGKTTQQALRDAEELAHEVLAWPGDEHALLKEDASSALGYLEGLVAR